MFDGLSRVVVNVKFMTDNCKAFGGWILGRRCLDPVRRLLNAILFRKNCPFDYDLVQDRAYIAPHAGGVATPQKSGVGIGPDAKVWEVSACERQAR
jgi:hypothetical protein